MAIDVSGNTVKLKIKLSGQDIPNSMSNNLIADITGSTYPDEVCSYPF